MPSLALPRYPAGAASVQVSSLPVLGENDVTATYSGDATLSGSALTSIPVTAFVGPVAVLTGGDVTVDSGTFMSNHLSFSDPNPGVATWTIYVDFGDGNTWTSPTYYVPGDSSIGYQYQSFGTYTVTIDVTDNLSGFGETTFNANV